VAGPSRPTEPVLGDFVFSGDPIRVSTKMEGIVVVLIGVMVGYWIFRAGKREVLTKGYGVGRRHERR
jgi:hypothetical protein